MTVTDPRSGSPRHARPEVFPTAPTVAWPAAGVPVPPVFVPRQRIGAWPHDEPPAGLGPWVPPLPEPERQLTPRVLTWFGVTAVVLAIGAAAAVAVILGATPPSTASDDALYLTSVRDNSGLTSADVSDALLVDTGHGICGTLEKRPTMMNVLSTMKGLGESFGWNNDDVAAVVGSAIGAYCPQYVPIVST